eukprot:35383-Eustigmatos_ZCMA.PRE.1
MDTHAREASCICGVASALEIRQGRVHLFSLAQASSRPSMAARWMTTSATRCHSRRTWRVCRSRIASTSTETF